MALPSGVV